MSGKILIVDDEVHIRMLLEQTLEELEEDCGVEILSAQNGEEGLALIRSEKPDLVFLDIMMPKLNGYEVCQRGPRRPRGRRHRHCAAQRPRARKWTAAKVWNLGPVGT